MSDLISTTRQHIAAEADALAGRAAILDYTSRKAASTLRNQLADLKAFSAFLAGRPGYDDLDVDQHAAALQSTPEAWGDVTFGLLEAFKLHMVNSGYAVATVNRRLSTLKKYASLAFKAGTVTTDTHARIKMVAGYGGNEGANLDDQRDQTRRDDLPGNKKAQHTSIGAADAKLLKDQPTTPQGRRDAVLLCLLVDHGLRCGEAARLTVDNFDLDAGMMTFYRPKVKKHQTHQLSRDTLAALREYFDAGDAPVMGPLLRSSKRGGELTDSGMSERAITKRVAALGRAAGIAGLSAHDLRHHWATKAAEDGVNPLRLQEAGGWSSLAMPRRYVEAAKIANEGMV